MLENIPLSSKLANIYHVVTLELHGESSIYTGSALLIIIVIFFQLKIYIFFLFSNLEFDFVAFCSFFQIASLFFNRGRQPKSVELDNRIISSYFDLVSVHIKKSPLNATKHSVA